MVLGAHHFSPMRRGPTDRYQQWQRAWLLRVGCVDVARARPQTHDRQEEFGGRRTKYHRKAFRSRAFP